MTKDQIEMLRKLTVKLPTEVRITVEDGPEGEKTGEFVRAVLVMVPHILPRLLDEREALLEALTDAVEAIAGEWGESSAADLRAAIAKARSP